MTLALCIILLVVAVAICVLVMMQSDKDTKLSGTLAGGTDTYFGKNKGNSRDKLLSNITAILSAVFVVLVVVMYIIG
jgi:preprotein translocase subunit SecG